MHRGAATGAQELFSCAWVIRWCACGPAQVMSRSKEAPLHSAQQLWQRLQPGRRSWPKGFSSGRSIEAYVPDADFGTLQVRVHWGEGHARGLAFHMQRVEDPDYRAEGPCSHLRDLRAT